MIWYLGSFFSWVQWVNGSGRGLFAFWLRQSPWSCSSLQNTRCRSFDWFRSAFCVCWILKSSSDLPGRSWNSTLSICIFLAWSFALSFCFRILCHGLGSVLSFCTRFSNQSCYSSCDSLRRPGGYPICSSRSTGFEKQFTIWMKASMSFKNYIKALLHNTLQQELWITKGP